MQNSSGTVKHCIVFRRSNTGVVILLDIDGRIKSYVVNGGNIIDAKSHDFDTVGSAIGEGIRVYKSGKSCFVSFEAFRATSAYAVNETIVTLPESFRPAYAVSFMDTLGASHQRIIINTDGTILSTSAITNGQGIRGSVSYVTA